MLAHSKPVGWNDCLFELLWGSSAGFEAHGRYGEKHRQARPDQRRAQNEHHKRQVGAENVLGRGSSEDHEAVHPPTTQAEESVPGAPRYRAYLFRRPRMTNTAPDNNVRALTAEPEPISGTEGMAKAHPDMPTTKSIIPAIFTEFLLRLIQTTVLAWCPSVHIEPLSRNLFSFLGNLF